MKAKDSELLADIIWWLRGFRAADENRNGYITDCHLETLIVAKDKFETEEKNAKS